MQIVFFVLLCGWLIFNWFQTIQLILRLYTPVPVQDYWRVPSDMVAYKTAGLHVFWRQHNEHRILFPEMVFVLDMLVDRGRQILPIIVSFLCYLCTWFVLAWTLFSIKELSSGVRWTAIVLAGIIIGWKGCAAVLAVPFLLQWTLMGLGAVLSIVCLAQVKKKSNNVYLVAAIVSAVVATYSSSNAMVLWPILLGAGLLLRLSWRQMSGLAITATVSLGLYFVGYQFTGSVNIANFVAHPVYSLGFLGSYLSMPFGDIKSPQFPVYVGLSSLLIVILLGTVAISTRVLRSQPAIVFFGSYLFTVLTAILTAAGRMDPQDSNFTTAKPYRYLTVPLVNWAIVILLCIWLSSRLKLKSVATPLIIVVSAVLLFVDVSKLNPYFRPIENEFADNQVAELSLGEGLMDPMSVRKIFPQPEFVFSYVPYLRDHHLSVFAGNRYKWLGRPAAKFAAKLPGPAAGQVSYVFPVRSGLEVVGWFDESDQRRPSQWILLTNEKDQIVGFGRKMPAGFPGELRSPETAYSQGWVGFVNFRFTARTYFAYVINRAGLVPLAGEFSVPPVAAAARGEMGAPIPGIQWRKDPTWTSNGLPRYVNFGIAPPGSIYSSWSGNDLNTGQMISSTFATPANGCLIVPVLHGLSADGQSVEIIDADNGEILQRAPMQSGDLQWEFWRFSLTSDVKHVQIIARDQGSSWGQWVAISDPAECR